MLFFKWLFNCSRIIWISCGCSNKSSHNCCLKGYRYISSGRILVKDVQRHEIKPQKNGDSTSDMNIPKPFHGKRSNQNPWREFTPKIENKANPRTREWANPSLPGINIWIGCSGNKRPSSCKQVSPGTHCGPVWEKQQTPWVLPSPKVIAINSLHPWVLHLWIPPISDEK